MSRGCSSGVRRGLSAVFRGASCPRLSVGCRRVSVSVKCPSGVWPVFAGSQSGVSRVSSGVARCPSVSFGCASSVHLVVFGWPCPSKATLDDGHRAEKEEEQEDFSSHLAKWLRPKIVRSAARSSDVLGSVWRPLGLRRVSVPWCPRVSSGVRRLSVWCPLGVCRVRQHKMLKTLWPNG